jgi:hypothetical protein
MATVAEIQAQLDPQGFGKKIKIEKQFSVSTTDTFFCIGGAGLAGRARWCPTTNTDSAALQAAAITSAMEA